MQPTGFRLGENQGPWGPFMPVTHGLSQELFWGTTAQLAPIFRVEDPEASVLGQVVVDTDSFTVTLKPASSTLFFTGAKETLAALG